MKTKRNTVAKTTIIELLKESGWALSHADIQNKIEGVCDRVTIYRILDRLYVEEKIHKTVGIDGVVKYAFCHHDSFHNHHHVHFNCERCLSTTCLEKLNPSFNLPEGYVMKDLNFTINGLCPKCK